MARTPKLDIQLPLRIVGIQILKDTTKQVRRNLDLGWYPFVECKNDIGTDENGIPEVSADCPFDYYQINRNLPRVSVSAIVGKNGSGKSTLLDIFYMILNNFSESLYLEGWDDPEPKKIKHALGLNARLFFELDGVMKFVRCSHFGTSYCEVNKDGKPVEVNIAQISVEERNNILRGFFYTISVNYSLYAFNPSDYHPLIKTGNELVDECGNWLTNLFHKNDGYYVPIVLTPFRENGTIDVNKEKTLALQRLNILSLLFHSQGREFLTDYVPDCLDFEFDLNYKNRKMEELYKVPIRYELKYCFDDLCRRFEEAWNKKLLDEYGIELLQYDDNPRGEIEAFYLAYKSIKIAMTYPGYSDIFERDSLLKLVVPEKEIIKNALPDRYVIRENDLKNWMAARHDANVNNVVDEIFRNSNNHITAKIHQCLSYIKGEHYHEDKGVISVEDLLANKRYESYDEVMKLLPPAFFKVDLKYRKKSRKKNNDEDLISIQSMSSGERQMLYMMSYIFYHIHNISTIKENGKRVVGYHHINLIFDECELYYHPEFQRVFLCELLDKLGMCHINRTIIRSINIILVTHSPFVLSDIPRSNILFLPKKASHDSNATQPMGANVYDLLDDCFFLDSAIGGVIERKLNEILQVYNDKNPERQVKKYIERANEFQYTVSHLGEKYLKDAYSQILSELDEKIGLNGMAYSQKVLESIMKMYEGRLKDLRNQLNQQNNEENPVPQQ